MITIIVCTYNSGRTIKKCIESILKQKGEKKVITIDAHSTDDTLSILAKFNKKIEIINNKEKISLGTAREIGLKMAKTKYVSFIDSDVEIIGNEWIQNTINILEREKKVAAVGGPGISPYNDPVSRSLNLLLYGLDKNTDRKFVNSLPTMNIVYSREVIDGLEFNKNLWMGEDVDFSFKIRKKGYKLLFDRKLKVIHHHPSTFKQLIKKWFRYGLYFRDAYKLHSDMRTKFYYLLVLYMPLLIVISVLTIINNSFAILLLLQIISPFLIYLYIGLKNRIMKKDLMLFVILHSFKQISQSVGIFCSFWRFTK